MKISNLAYITRSQITALATAMAQIKIPNFKASQKSIVSVFAALESLNLESFLALIDKEHEEAYKITEKVAKFLKDKEGKYHLVSVDVSIAVFGYSSERYITICSGIMNKIDEDKNHFVLSEQYIYPQISSGGRNSRFLNKVLNKNLRLAINKSFEICEEVVDNIFSNHDVFEKNGWDVEFLN